jgi:hypothetical protein
MACIACTGQIKITGTLQIEADYAGTGRCCEGGVCSIGLSGECSGVWTSGGTICDYEYGDPCYDIDNMCEGYGACCDGETCCIRNEDDCLGLGHFYLGDSISCVTPSNPCLDPTGECCNGGECTINTEGACSGSWSPGGDCDPNNCPAGGHVLSFF